MSLNKTRYLRKKDLDHAFGRVAFTMPNPVYIALFSADPTDLGTLTDEVTESGYARVSITSLMADAVLATGQISNNAEIVVGPALEDWPEITHAAIMDALTAGNMLYLGPAVTARVWSAWQFAAKSKRSGASAATGPAASHTTAAA